MPVTDQAFVTLATSDVYGLGALVLGHSLRHHRTSRQLVILITPQVSSSIRTVLDNVFDEVIEVNGLDSGDTAHLALMKRPDLGITFTKLQCWTLIQYSKCVFLDADTLVLCNVDELFDREEFSAAPDPGWPDCFNTGVFVFRPSLQTYGRLLQFAGVHGSFDGGDQGLLNSFFHNWAVKDIDKHLPFLYNLNTSSTYTYLPAFRQFGHEAKIVHFLGAVKPWSYKYNPQSRNAYQELDSPTGHHDPQFVNLWWKVYSSCVVPAVMKHEEVKLSNLSKQKNQEEITKEIKTEDLPSVTENSLSPWQASSLVVTPIEENQNANEEESLNSPQTFPKDKMASSPEHQTKWIAEKQLNLVNSVSQLSIEIKTELSDPEDRKRWEEGRMDYMGRDSFENIKKKLDRFLEQ
ncbi:glycogenin-1 isoform X1 [Erpetoichthys calabaricus]|uniref:glycogenin glucosyltransferase n=1 Tax=Erpetoichthys calabaricus TaxID=27687 RepID=A0A8C4SKL3_ERPCA|nr:glycogenin-1 isoform X1 [Erpetoichthys calabaricus]